jgi:hypothetical protein
VPREGEVVVDCMKVRRLIFEECALISSAVERRTAISHAVWYQMTGGSRKHRHSQATVTEDSARAVIGLARTMLNRTEQELPLAAILTSDHLEKAELGRVPGTAQSKSELRSTCESSMRWAIVESRMTEGLVELRLHLPRPGNVDQTFYIDATLRFGVSEFNIGDCTVLIGLKDAFLSIDSEAFQPAKGSMLGERNDNRFFRRSVGGIRILGPREGRCLVGDPLGDEHVVIMERSLGGDEQIGLTVHAGRLSFDVTITDDREERREAAPMSKNKNAILNALILDKTERDTQGRAVLACSAIQRKS